MGKSERPLSRKEDLVVQELNGEVLIYDLRKNKAFCLNETSALVWQACDGNNSVSDIGNKVGSEDIVWLALDELKKERLIEDGTSPVSKFEGMSRRDVIKKIGIGSMIALPVVASLVAPTATHAQSCRANDAACSASAQCCSNCCKNVSPSVNQCKPGGGACLP
jgi:hypothetical protein